MSTQLSVDEFSITARSGQFSIKPEEIVTVIFNKSVPDGYYDEVNISGKSSLTALGISSRSSFISSEQAIFT